MRYLGFDPFRTNGYVCMIVDVDKSELGETTNNGLLTSESYYEYFLIHVDDLMVDNCRAEQLMQAIRNT